MSRMGHDLREYLDRVIAVIGEVVGDGLVALWAVGSLATGDFDERTSDVDLIGVFGASLEEREAEALAGALSHGRLACPAHGLDLIAYLEAELGALRRTPEYEFSLSTGRDWEDEVGRGGPYAGGIPDLALARSRGVPLAGPLPAQVLAPVPAAWVGEEVVDAIRWHKDRIHDPFHDPQGTNAVLNACRACCFLHTGELVSKSEGALWMLRRHDEEVVRMALASRREAASDPLDRRQVMTFLEAVLSTHAEREKR